MDIEYSVFCKMAGNETPFAEEQFTPSISYAEFERSLRSDVKVVPFNTVPLFPFPLSSLALPLNGHQPTRPSAGR
jgi:hypothetical protein